MYALLPVLVRVLVTHESRQVQLGRVVDLLNVVGVYNQGTCRRTQYHVTVVQVDDRTARVLSVNAITVVDADDAVIILRIGKGKTVLRSDDDTVEHILVNAIDIIGGQTVPGRQVAALTRR